MNVSACCETAWVEQMLLWGKQSRNYSNTVLKMGQKYPRFLETNQNITFAKPLKMPIFVRSGLG